MKIPILNIRKFEKEELLNDFYSNSFYNHIVENRDQVNKPHSHDFFLCVFFTRGTGKHEIDFNTYPIVPGAIFFLKPGQTHFWEFEEIPEGFIFFHTQEFHDFYFLNHKLSSFPFWFSINNPPIMVLHPEKIKKIEPLFEEINSEYAKEEAFKRIKLVNLLNLVYVELSREYSSTELNSGSTSPAYIKILRGLETLVEEFYRVEKSAKFYADKLNITNKHLNRVTRETLNKTTTDLITERVILEARRLIVHSTNTLSELGEMLGYSDYAYFSKVFKLKTGMTPLEFKRAYQ